MKILFLILMYLPALVAPDQTTDVSPLKDTAIALASNQVDPKSLAIDDEYVYWVCDHGQSIKRVSKAGGVPEIVATGKTINQIVVDDESIFFTVIGEIRRVSKTGGNATTLVKSELIAYATTPMAVDANNLYYFEEVGVPPGTVDKNPLLRKVNKRGGSPVTLSARTYLRGGFATDGINVYWVDNWTDAVYRISVNGGRVVTHGRCRGIDLIVDTTTVFCWGATFVKFKRAGTESVQLSAIQRDSANRLLQDKLNLYFTATKKRVHGIYRVAKTGGPPELMAPLDWRLRDFVVDETSIFWTNSLEGTVMRMNK